MSERTNGDLLAIKFDCKLDRVEEHKIIRRGVIEVATVWTFKHKKGTIALRTKGDVIDFPRNIGTEFSVEFHHVQSSFHEENRRGGTDT